jgi:hypothetical protein
MVMVMAHSAKAASLHLLKMVTQTLSLATGQTLSPNVLSAAVPQIEQSHRTDFNCLPNDERYRDGLKFA